jgi:5'-nucleotidase
VDQDDGSGRTFLRDPPTLKVKPVGAFEAHLLEVEALVGGGLLGWLANGGGETCRHEEPDAQVSQGQNHQREQALLKLNDGREEPIVEVMVMSRNSPETGLRIFNSLDHYELQITRAALTGGEYLARYMEAFKVDLFLSKDESDVQEAVNAGVAAARVYDPPPGFEPDTETVRIAFDYDGVLVSEESEKIYQNEGIEAFWQNEKEKAKEPPPEGPFKKLLTTLAQIQSEGNPSDPRVRIAVVTARNSPAHERVIRTLRSWNVHVNSAFFMGGVPKDEVLKAFRAHIFFDDQEVHLSLAAASVPSAHVPYIIQPDQESDER